MASDPPAPDVLVASERNAPGFPQQHDLDVERGHDGKPDGRETDELGGRQRDREQTENDDEDPARESDRPRAAAVDEPGQRNEPDRRVVENERHREESEVDG